MKFVGKTIRVLGLSVGLVLGLALTSQGLKAAELVEMKEVVVTGTRTEVPVEESASDITIITRKTLHQKHLKTVADALRQVPGLDLVRSGGLGGTTSAFIRGGNSSHTLVLIDGVQVNNATTGAYDFGDLTTENIERIEIIRGPQSTLYGSDAIGGVIHIITRRGTGETRGSVRFEAGSHRTFREEINFRGATDKTDYTFSASRLDSKGFSRANESDGNSEKDGYENSTLTSRWGLSLGQGGRLEWTARFTDSETEIDGCCPADDLDRVSDRRSLATSVKLDLPIMASWDQQVQLSFNQDDLRVMDPDSASIFKTDTYGKRMDWRHNLVFGKLLLITLGYEFEAQNAKSPGAYDRNLINNAAYLFNQVHAGPLTFNFGGRFDDHNRFGSETTYKVEAAYFLSATNTKIRGAHGTGFRGPTVLDIVDFPPFFFGNPSLDPERSKGFDAGIEQKLWNDRFKLTLTYFENRIEDLIVFVSDPITFVGTVENLDRVKIKGRELQVAFTPIESVSLSGSYTYSNGENEETGLKLARRPRQKASGSVTIQTLDSLRVVLDVRYVGSRFSDTANTPSLKMADHTVFDLGTSYSMDKEKEIYLRVGNVFDREYEEVAGFGTSGIAAFAGLRVTFR